MWAALSLAGESEPLVMSHIDRWMKPLFSNPGDPTLYSAGLITEAGPPGSDVTEGPFEQPLTLVVRAIAFLEISELPSSCLLLTSGAYGDRNLGCERRLTPPAAPTTTLTCPFGAGLPLVRTPGQGKLCAGNFTGDIR